MRHPYLVPLVLIGAAVSAPAQVSLGIGIGLPGVNIGIHFPVLPRLVRVPGYPVYYAPGLESNYFFYDGMYWVFEGDAWYASSWYDGPWYLVGPETIPLYVLRIPVGYYQRPPSYFGGWQRNAPPRWGDHWGNGWAQRRHGWDRWDRRSAPAPAAIPTYQRSFAGDRYPGAAQQRDLHAQNYHHQPREAVVREHYQQQRTQAAPAPAARAPQRDRQPARAPREDPRSPREGREAKPPPAPVQPRAPRPTQPPPSEPRPMEPNRPRPGERDHARPEPPSRPEKDPRRPERGQERGQERDRREERPKDMK